MKQNSKLRQLLVFLYNKKSIKSKSKENTKSYDSF